jgi:hypothetical protein
MIKPLSLSPLPIFESFSTKVKLQGEGAAPLPTFESFSSEKAKQKDSQPRVEVDPVIIRQPTNESASLDAEQVAAFLDEVLDGMNAARLNATQRYPDPEEAKRYVFEWACEVLKGKLERELGEEEKTLVKKFLEK